MKNLIFACFSILCAQAVQAETVTYDCSVNDRDDRGWIAPRYVFVIDPEQATAEIASNHNDYQPAKYKLDRKQRFSLTWRLDMREISGSSVRVSYTARINPNDNSVVVRGKWINANFVNKPYGTGNCKVKKN